MVKNELAAIACSSRTSGAWWGMRAAERKPVTKAVLCSLLKQNINNIKSLQLFYLLFTKYY